MVAIVSGNSLGLSLSSLAVLGQRGVHGTPTHGSSGEGVYVNVANGNLVLQTQDDLLVGRGPDAVALRTYNSQGLLNDDNGDNWSSGFWLQPPLVLTGGLNTAGSTIKRTDRDGASATYNYDSLLGHYRSSAGEGAHDTIRLVSADGQLEWRDGSSGLLQRYEAGGAFRLLSTRDPSGNALTYGYDAAGRVVSVVSGSGETTFYDYTEGNLTQVRTVDSANSVLTRVRYGYDGSNRLSTVSVDLTPGDNSIVDAKVLRTTYSYDGSSKRVTGIAQSDGSSVVIAYALDAVTGSYRVAGVANALNEWTTIAYTAPAGMEGSAVVRNALGIATTYMFDAAGHTTRITSPTINYSAVVREYAYNVDGDVISMREGSLTTVFQYDASGNLVLERDYAGNTVRRTFDADNRLLNETRYLVPDVDGDGMGEASVPATSRHVYHATNARGLLRFEISAEGRVTEHRYDGFGQRIATLAYTGGTYSVSALPTDATLTEADVAAWASWQPATAVQRADMAYDSRGLLQSRTTYAKVDAGGQGVHDGTQSREAFVYDRAGLLLQRLSATGGATNYMYDGLGREITRIDASGQVTLIAYGDTSARKVQTDSNGLVTTMLYDAAGRMTSIAKSAPGGAVLGETKYFHDAAGRLRMTQDPTGVRSWVLYDLMDRKTGSVDGNGTLTEYLYDSNGNVGLTVTYATAVNTDLLIDASGTPVLTATVDGIRPVTSTGDVKEWHLYDAAQRLGRTARTVGTGTTAAATWTFYDGASRPTATIAYATPVEAARMFTGFVRVPAASPQDRLTRNFHDADGLLLATLDAEGYLRRFNYDAAGRLVERIGYATATEVSLRRAGTLAQLTPQAAAGDARSFLLYDAQGRVMAEVDAENYLTESVYDQGGALTQSIRYANKVTAAVTATSTLATIRPLSTAADRVSTRTYDAVGRIKEETSPEGVITQYGYDSAGNLASTTKAAGSGEVRTLLARYDARGLLTGELSAEGAALLTGGQTQAQVDAIWQQHGSAHAYDLAGRRISTTNALGERSFFYYDADGRQTHAVNGKGEVKEDRYDVLGRLIEQVAYAGRLNTASYVGGLSNPWLLADIAAIANQALDSRVTYTYSNAGQVASRTDALGNTNTYSYNVFGDEISSTEAVGSGVSLTRSHTLDRRGQRMGTVTDASGANVVTSAVFDAFGRTVRSIDGNGNVREQVFDRLGRW